MPRYKTTVLKLAREAGLSVEEAIITLLDNDISVEKPNDIVPKKKMTLARSLLGIDSETDSSKRVVLSCLAREYNIDESDFRNILVSKRIISKRNQKWVNKVQSKSIAAVINSLSGEDEEHISIACSLDDEKAKKKKEKKKTKTDRNEDVWPTIGNVEVVNPISAKDTEEIHWLLVNDFKSSKEPIDPPGVKNEHLLESALFRPMTSLGDVLKYPTIPMFGAAILHSIIQDHPFHNGNKRTALVALLVFLDKNGWIISVDQNDIYDFLIEVSSHNLIDKKSGLKVSDSDQEVIVIASWLRNNIRRIRRGEQPLAFRQLRTTLISYGCDFDQRSRRGCTVIIKKDDLSTSMHYGGDGREVSTAVIHKIRKDLHLDELHGYDSDIFYNKGERIPEFINKYRKVLDRLAKV